ncbi:hypothetical protein Ancab_004335 [Ancistrocladus abbreviatus]
MIACLNYLAPILLSIIAILAGLLMKGRLDLDRIWKPYEPLKDSFLFTRKLWNWYDDINDNMRRLEEQMKSLQSRERDVKENVVHQEQKTGRQLKEEANNWLKNVERMVKEVHKILENERRSLLLRILYRIRLGNCVKKNIEEIEMLLGSSLLQSDLLSQTKRNTALVTTDLVGEAASSCIGRVLEWVRNDQGPRIIGVLGEGGVGKTAVVKAVYNQLRESNVYPIYINGENIDNEPQIEPQIAIAIAKDVLDRDTRDEDEVMRTAILQDALKRKNHFVLILDGLSQHFDLEKVGIPINLNGGIQPSRGKLIITTRLRDVCRRMCSGVPIPLEGLSDLEAEKLFDEVVDAPTLQLNQEIENFKRGIIRSCENIPGKIKQIAQQLRGEGDIIEWITKWNDLQLSISRR